MDQEESSLAEDARSPFHDNFNNPAAHLRHRRPSCNCSVTTVSCLSLPESATSSAMTTNGLKGRLSRAMGKVSRKMMKLSLRKKKARGEETTSEAEVFKESLLEQHLKEESSEFYRLKETLAQQALQAQDEKLGLKEPPLSPRPRPRPSETRSKFAIEALRKEFCDAQEENVRLKNILRHRLPRRTAESVIATCQVPYIVTDAHVEPAEPDSTADYITATATAATTTPSAEAVLPPRPSHSSLEEGGELTSRRRTSSSHKKGGIAPLLPPPGRRRSNSSSTEGDGKVPTITVAARRRRSFRSRNLNQALPLERSPSQERLNVISPSANTIASSPLVLRGAQTQQQNRSPWNAVGMTEARRPPSPLEKIKQSALTKQMTPKKHESAVRKMRSKFFIEALRCEFEERRDENTKLRNIVRQSMPGDEAELVIARCNPLLLSALTEQPDETASTLSPNRTRPRRRRSFRSRRRSRTDDSITSFSSSLGSSQAGDEEGDDMLPDESRLVLRYPSQRELRDQEEGLDITEQLKLKVLLRERLQDLKVEGATIFHDGHNPDLPPLAQQLRSLTATQDTRRERKTGTARRKENNLRSKFVLEALRCEFHQRKEENAKLKDILRRLLPVDVAEAIIAHCAMQFVPEELPSYDPSFAQTTATTTTIDPHSHTPSQSTAIITATTSSPHQRIGETSGLRTKFVLEALRAEFHQRRDENVKLKELLRGALPPATAEAVIARCIVEFVPPTTRPSEQSAMPTSATIAAKQKKAESQLRAKFVLEALRAEFHQRQTENAKLKEVIRRVFASPLAEGIIGQCSVQFKNLSPAGQHRDQPATGTIEIVATATPETVQQPLPKILDEIVSPVFISSSHTSSAESSSPSREEGDSSPKKRIPARSSSFARLMERERSALRVKYLIEALSNQFYDRKDENAALKRIIRTRFPPDEAEVTIARCTSNFPSSSPTVSPRQQQERRRRTSSSFQSSTVTDFSGFYSNSTTTTTTTATPESCWPRRKKYALRFKFVVEALRWEFHQRQEENLKLKQLVRKAIAPHVAEEVIVQCKSVDKSNRTATPSPPPIPSQWTVPFPPLTNVPKLLTPIPIGPSPSSFVPTAMSPPVANSPPPQPKSALRMKFMIEAAAKEFNDSKRRNEKLKRLLWRELPDEAASIISDCTVPLIIAGNEDSNSPR